MKNKIYGQFLKSEELLERIFSNYFDEVEGTTCCVDKARFVVKKMFESEEKQEVLSLQYTYGESKYAERFKDSKNKKCYWCPNTITNTDEAFDTLMNLINPRRVDNFIKKQIEKNEPYKKEEIEETKRYYLARLSLLQEYEGGLTVEQYIENHLKEYPDISLNFTILDAKTGTPKYFYDGLTGYAMIDRYKLRDKKIVRISEKSHYKNQPPEQRTKFLMRFSHIEATIE